MEDQDRARWDHAGVDAAMATLRQALAARRVGPYQLQAAIAGAHMTAPSPAETDWRAVVGLYDVLLMIEPRAVVALNRAVAVAMVDGPGAGLALIEDLAAEGELDRLPLPACGTGRPPASPGAPRRGRRGVRSGVGAHRQRNRALVPHPATRRGRTLTPTSDARRSTTMKYRNLGRTGLKVTPLCLGAMMFGQWGNPDHDDSVSIIHTALDAGINFIDTADVYSSGESEEIVGRAIKGRRDDLVIATKVHAPMGTDPNMTGNSRRWIISRVRGQPPAPRYRLHRPVPDPPSRALHRHLRDARRPERPGPPGQDPLPRQFDLSGGQDRRGPVGVRAAEPRAVRQRAAAVLACSSEASRPRCCRRVRSTAWASSPGVRSPAGGCRAGGERGPRT